MIAGVSSGNGVRDAGIMPVRACKDALSVSPVASRFTEPIADSVNISHTAVIQNDMINGLKYWASRWKVEFDPNNLDATIQALKGNGTFTEDDIKVIAVAYGFAQRAGYAAHQAERFRVDLSSFRDRGPNTWVAGNEHPTPETVNFDAKVLGSKAFETTLIPKDFLINGFDTQSTIFEGEQAKFTAELMRHLSASPDQELDGTYARAMIVLRPHQQWVFNNFKKDMIRIWGQN